MIGPTVRLSKAPLASTRAVTPEGLDRVWPANPASST